MKLKYLGTAAAEGIPAMFCNCPTCQKTRELGGMNYRTRSQTLINDDLLIDFGPDTYYHLCKYNLDLTKIRTILITHAHEDHLTPTELLYREHGYAYLSGDKKNEDEDFPRVKLCISDASSAYIPKEDLEPTGIDLCIVAPFETYTCGKYTVTPLRANHAPGYDALIYIISDGEKTVLYAHDTGHFPEDTVDYLRENKPHFDFVSLDCTGMRNHCGKYHMGIPDNAEIKAYLTEFGCTDAQTIWYCNHFSHNGECTHEEFVPLAAEHGFLVSYDGSETEI